MSAPTYDVLLDGEVLTREGMVRALGGVPPARTPLLFDEARGLSRAMAESVGKWCEALGVSVEVVVSATAPREF